MSINENWALSLQREEDFFSSQSDVENIGDHRYRFGDCIIELSPLPPGRIGSSVIARTLVSFGGEGPDTEKIHRRFFLQFLSAGG